MSLYLWVSLCFIDRIMWLVFQIPYVNNVIWYLSFSFWLTSLTMISSRSILLQGALFHFPWLNSIPLYVCMNIYVCVYIYLLLLSHSVVSGSFVTPWTIACQAPLFMGLSRWEYWHGLPFSSPGDLPDPEIELGTPALQAVSSHLSHQGSPHIVEAFKLYCSWGK